MLTINESLHLTKILLMLVQAGNGMAKKETWYSLPILTLQSLINGVENQQTRN